MSNFVNVMFSNKCPYFGLHILYHIHHDLASLEATPQAAKADTEKSVFDQDTLPATETQLEKERSWRSPSPTPSQATESTLRAPSSAKSVVWLGVLIFLVLFIAFSFYVFVSLRPQGVVTDLSTFCQHDILYTMCWQVMRLLMMW